MRCNLSTDRGKTTCQRLYSWSGAEQEFKPTPLRSNTTKQHNQPWGSGITHPWGYILPPLGTNCVVCGKSRPSASSFRSWTTVTEGTSLASHVDQRR